MSATMASSEGLNCIDIVAPYARAVTAEGMPPVQFLGGVGSVALRDEATVIHFDEDRIIAPSGLWLPQYRDEGTLRDVETLVLSSDSADAEKVQACAEEYIGSQLVIETCPVLDIARVHRQQEAPFGREALMTFLGDRYADPAQGADAPMIKALFPFAAPIQPDVLRTTTLEIDGTDITMPVPSVGTNILNYLTRSISGARPKDADKLEEMGQAIFAKAPEVVDWIIDGPGKEQFELARVLHTLRESRRNPKSLTVGGKLVVGSYDHTSLAEHPAFLLRDADETTQRRAIALARLKSRGLHTGENMQFLTGPFQKYVEPRIKGILHNTGGHRR